MAVAAAGKEFYKRDQERTIWLNADETDYEAYRLADGRVYVEFLGKEHNISVMTQGQAETDDREVWFVVSGDYENVILEGAGKDSGTVICGMNDDLPPADEGMEANVAEYEKAMEHSVG